MAVRSSNSLLIALLLGNAVSLSQFIFPTVPAAIINIINFCLMFAALGWLGWYLRYDLQHQEIDLTGLAARLRSTTDRGGILALHSSLQATGVLARRLDRLRRMADRGGDVDHAGLAGSTVAELDNVLAFPRYGASVAVLIGLFGTLVGLSRAVGGGALLLQAGTLGIDQMPSHLLTIFEGLGIAFSNTLVGVFCTVVIGFCTTYVRSRQTKYLVALEDLTAGNILPYFQPSPSTALAQAAAALTSMQSDLKVGMTRLLDSLSASGDRLLDEVEARIGTLADQVRERGIAMASTIDSSMAQLISDLKQVLTECRGANQKLAELLGVSPDDHVPLLQSVDTLRRAAEASAAAAASVEQLIPSLTEALELQADRQTRDLHQAMTDYVSGIAGALRQHQAALEGAARLSAKQSSDIVAHSVSELTAPLQTLARIHEESRTVMGEVRDAIRAMGRRDAERPFVAEMRGPLYPPPADAAADVSRASATPGPTAPTDDRVGRTDDRQRKGLFARFFGGDQ